MINAGLVGVYGMAIAELLEEHKSADVVEFGWVASLTGSAAASGRRRFIRRLKALPHLRTPKKLFPSPHDLRTIFEITAQDEVWLAPSVLGDRKEYKCIGVGARGYNSFLRLLNWSRRLKVVPEFLFLASLQWKKGKAPPKEASEEPIRARMALYQQGRLLAARGLIAEGDYNSSSRASALFADEMLKRGAEALPVGMHYVEEVFKFKDLQAKLEAIQIFVRPLAA